VAKDEKKGDTQQDEGLTHSVGGVTTRDDVLDLGVPMLQGDRTEPTGPEDALGPGPKRGDYSGRLGDSYYNPHTTEAIPVEEREEGGPWVRVKAQAERAAEQGEVPGKKGGVNSAE